MNVSMQSAQMTRTSLVLRMMVLHFGHIHRRVLGKALLGHRVGDRVEVRVNDDYSYFVTIRKIENTVDDGTDKLRKF